MSLNCGLGCHECYYSASKTEHWLRLELQLPETSIGFHLTIWSITFHNNWDGQLVLGSGGLHYYWAFSSIYLQVNGRVTKMALEALSSSCLLDPSLDTSWLPSPTSVFFFSHHLWPGPVLSGRGLMLRVLCTVYKSISDGYVWMLATLNLIKWEHRKNEHKNFRQQFSEDFFTCLCTHPRILFTMDWALKTLQRSRNQI